MDVVFVQFLPMATKMGAQSSTFTTYHNNKPGLINTDMGGPNKGCIYMWDTAASDVKGRSPDV